MSHCFKIRPTEGSFKRDRAMKGGTFLCFVILLNVCATLTAISKGDETGITKLDGYKPKHNRHRLPSKRSRQIYRRGFSSTLNNQRRFNRGTQCSAIIHSPPAPDSGCCGIEIANRPKYPVYPLRRFLRNTRDSTVETKTYSDRIAGGKVTRFEQFPWTVLINSTFYNGNIYSDVICGGSIISARYVLTAAHCIRAKDNNLTEIKIILSEFDKDTFPIDCEWVAGEGRRCIRNIRTDVENYLVHPGYNENIAFSDNDIALIRLRYDAPYTDFIRPICLPPFNIDRLEYADLNLTVAGWGLDGIYTTAVKQSTVFNLIPNCSAEYPELSKSYFCAAGRRGADICNGDSGGPLMMLYGGKYYLSGIACGRLLEAPTRCGAQRVPSAYTNVYLYLDWIMSNM